VKRLAAVALVLASCGKNPYEAWVDGVLLAEADGVMTPDRGPVVKLTNQELEPEVPDAPVARLAISWDVSWARVQTTIVRFTDKGVRPVLLVGRRSDVRAFELRDALEGPPIRVITTPDGKFCVSPPDNNEAKCVQSSNREHIGKAFVRETVREAVDAYGLRDVTVWAEPDVDWVDVVRTIDGARTCCDGKLIRVSLAD
jgi:hypothetical protein